jgi:hypothetical protein
VIEALFILASTIAQPEKRDPAGATGNAIMQCVAHAMGGGPINKDNIDHLAQNGLIFSEAPPEILRSTAQTPYGTASYALSPSTEGQVWAVGYDKGSCLIFTLWSDIAPIRKRIVDLFSIPNSWKEKQAAPAKENEEKLEYYWDPYPKMHLSALISLTDMAPSPKKGFVMITIGQTQTDGK